MRVCVAAVALLLAGCAGLRGSPGHELAVGRYRYVGQYLAPGAAEATTNSGVMVITASAPNRVVGVWQVPGFQQDIQFGTYVDGAYLVNADLPGPGTIGTFRHRVRRRAGSSELECVGTFLQRVRDTVVSRPATCSLELLGAR